MGAALDLEQIIEKTYECLVDETGWLDLLRSSAELVGGDGVVLYVRSRSLGGAGTCSTSVGIPSFNVDEYMTYWEPRSPLLARYRGLQEGVVNALGSYAFSAEYRETEFYRDWVRPQGYGDMLGSHLVQTPDLYAWLSIRRDVGRRSYSKHQVRLANRLGTHLSRAIKLRHRLELHSAKTANFKQSLDVAGFGLVLTDTAGLVLEINSTAGEILKRGQGLRLRSRQLVCDRSHENRALQRALAMPAGQGRTDLAVSRTEGGAPYFVHVVHLGTETNWHRLAPSASAVAVFIVDPKSGLENLESFASVHRLTAAELRLLREIVMCKGLPEAAHALGVAATTAKTQLQGIFRKTGTNSQTELVKLLMSTSLPLR